MESPALIRTHRGDSDGVSHRSPTRVANSVACGSTGRFRRVFSGCKIWVRYGRYGPDMGRGFFCATIRISLSWTIFPPYATISAPYLEKRANPYFHSQSFPYLTVFGPYFDRIFFRAKNTIFFQAYIYLRYIDFLYIFSDTLKYGSKSMKIRFRYGPVLWSRYAKIWV